MAPLSCRLQNQNNQLKEAKTHFCFFIQWVRHFIFYVVIWDIKKVTKADLKYFADIKYFIYYQSFIQYNIKVKFSLTLYQYLSKQITHISLITW